MKKNWDETGRAVPMDEEYEKGLHDRELEERRQQHQHLEDINGQRKELFDLFKKYIPWVVGVSYLAGFIVIFRPSGQGAVAAGLLTMFPAVIILAMIRVLYGNDKLGNTEKTAPSVVLNIGKELASVLKSYLSKKL